MGVLVYVSLADYKWVHNYYIFVYVVMGEGVSVYLIRCSFCTYTYVKGPTQTQTHTYSQCFPVYD